MFVCYNLDCDLMFLPVEKNKKPSKERGNKTRKLKWKASTKPLYGGFREEEENGRRDADQVSAFNDAATQTNNTVLSRHSSLSSSASFCSPSQTCWTDSNCCRMSLWHVSPRLMLLEAPAPVSPQSRDCWHVSLNALFRGPISLRAASGARITGTSRFTQSTWTQTAVNDDAIATHLLLHGAEGVDRSVRSVRLFRFLHSHVGRRFPQTHCLWRQNFFSDTAFTPEPSHRWEWLGSC